MAIANSNSHISRIDDHSYKVKSQSSNNQYDVFSTESGWSCSCLDNTYRKVTCKHIFAVQFSLNLRKEVQSTLTIEQLDTLSCIFCHSEHFVKDAVRHNKYGDIQRYLCKDCGKRFSFNVGFENMRATPQIITSAMQLYFSGESFRNARNFLKLQGVNVSHVAVYKWIKKYVNLMDKYLEKITPNVSTVWRTDELYLKVKGNKKYLFALMDDETRFWISQQVADKKNTSDVRPLFKEGKEIAQKRPSVLISDGAPNFHDAYKKEYFTLKNPRTKHIRYIRLQGDNNNNKQERFNGEIRDREKTMRGLKTVHTSILKGYQIYHNYIREHEGLNGQTPAEKCAITIEGNDKWRTIIENAKK
ncbi:MAG TPA: DDE-type integrase/transposase/recombinase [Nitrososphaeraceae archaeon]|nr:DDE-type integrase/transposase/recombinase [Nitrososphaeraceae archaeon]